MARQVIVVALIFMAVVGAFAADTKAPAPSPSTSPSLSPTASPSDAPASLLGIEVPNPGGEGPSEGPEADSIEENADNGGGDAPAPGPDAAEGKEPPADAAA